MVDIASKARPFKAIHMRHPRRPNPHRAERYCMAAGSALARFRANSSRTCSASVLAGVSHPRTVELR